MEHSTAFRKISLPGNSETATPIKIQAKTFLEQISYTPAPLPEDGEESLMAVEMSSPPD